MIRGKNDVTNSHILVVNGDASVGALSGAGLTLQLTQDLESFLDMDYNVDAQFIALQIGGGSG